MRTSLLIASALLAGAGAASAQAMQPLPMLAFEHLELDASALGSLALGSGKTLPQRRYRISSAFNYEMRPLVLYRDGARYGAVINDRFMLHLLAAYALTSRLELGLKDPVIARQAGADLSTAGFSSPSSAAAAAPGLGARDALLRAEAGAPVDLAAEFGQELPLGSGSSLTRDEGPSATPKLLASRQLGPVLVSVELGTRLRKAVSLAQDRVGSHLEIGASAVTDAVAERVRLELILRGTTPYTALPSALEVPLVTRLDVVLAGAGWTSAEAVRRLVSTQAGEPYDATELHRDLARLRGLGILYDVSAHLDGSRVEIEATDRWSLLPVLEFHRGGGRTTTQVGVTDHNAFGKLFTLYGELSSNAEVPFLGGDRIGSFVYAEIPRVFGTPLTPFLSWRRDFLDFAAFSPAGPGYVYDRARYAVRGELRYELSHLVSLTAGVEDRKDRYRTSIVSRAPGTEPSATDTVSALAGVQVGYIEELISQQRGTEVRVLTEAAQSGELTTTVQARGYFQPAERHNLCLQALLQNTTSRSESFLFHAGGAREIRGFIDSYFTGALMARVNAEWRIDVLRKTLLRMPFIGQLAAFADGGYVGRRGGAVAGLDYDGPILSGGLGLRGIPVPFARVALRIDVAAGIVPQRTVDVSFSAQQFF